MSPGAALVFIYDALCPPALLRCAERSAGWNPIPEALLEYHGSTDSGEVALVAVASAGPDLRARFPNALILARDASTAAADLLIVPATPAAVWEKVLVLATRQFLERTLAQVKLGELRVRDERIRQLADIGRALSSEPDPSRLLATILSEGRRLAACDAGSLYLVDVENAAPSLVFKLAQNDSVELMLQESRLPLTTASLSGYVAVTGRELNIADAYDIPAGSPYAFNRGFDAETGYRTRSLLVLPMRDHRDRVVGVLQFINRTVDGAVVPFDQEVAELLQAVASQAAIAIQKNGLIRDIKGLFESFVQASVKAIEQRDPSTSGHSSRVALYTTALLEALPRSGVPRFRDLALTEDHLTEVRYAALLHDFGKVSVREAVLVKARKLTDERLEILRYRFELQKERLRRAAVEAELQLLHDEACDFSVGRRRIQRLLAGQLGELDDYFAALSLANDPSILAQGDFRHLEILRDRRFTEIDGSEGGLITEGDLLALSVRQGSLTPDERREIQSHVIHTRDFLAVLPWPPELARVPLLAASHHEKLNGSGYPLGLLGDEIPLAGRVMTVCDIFDALTAMDRPYKRAVPAEAALRILEDEVAAGMLDADIVRIFVESGTYRIGAKAGMARDCESSDHRDLEMSPTRFVHG